MYFDISWDEVAKYIVATPESISAGADMINQYPDRFLFGTDAVAPASQRILHGVQHVGAALAKLTPDASLKLRRATTNGSSIRLAESPGLGSGQCQMKPLNRDEPLRFAYDD